MMSAAPKPENQSSPRRRRGKSIGTGRTPGGTGGRKNMPTPTLEETFAYPGERIGVGEPTDVTEVPADDEIEAFELELDAIASAEREAASDADLIHFS